MSGDIFSIPSIHLYINILQITWMISENSLFSLTHKSAILRNFACFWRWKLLKFHTVVSISSSISYLFEKQLVWIDFVASALFRILWNWTFFSKYSCFLIFRLSPPPFPPPLANCLYCLFSISSDPAEIDVCQSIDRLPKEDDDDDNYYDAGTHVEADGFLFVHG